MTTPLPPKTEITRADVIPMAEFAKVRDAKRKDLVEITRDRRVDVGPSLTLHFENYATVWWRVHEALFVGRDGEEHVENELRNGNLLIPKGHGLIATMTFEGDAPELREAMLSRTGGIEQALSLQFAGETVRGQWHEITERPSTGGQEPPVRFVQFPFTPGQIEKFQQPNIQVIAAIEDGSYNHMAVMPDTVRQTLAGDFL